jgi:Ca-activated chloride channel family protein
MDTLTFQRPEHLVWLWSLVGLALLLCADAWWRRRRLRALVSHLLLDRVVVGRSLGLEVTRAILLWLAVAALLLAWARPSWGETVVSAPTRGADVVLVLDASLSMLARDAAPDRLELARRELRRLLDQMGPARTGLVVFAGSGIKLVPLTTDRAAVATLLDAASPDAVPRAGTDLAAALASAGQILSSSKAPHRAVVLVTDGGDHGGNAADRARDLARAGIRLWLVGVGGADPVPIPLPDGTYKQDREGRTVTVALESARLRDLAGTADGAYLELSSTTWSLEPILASIAKAAGHDGPAGTRRVPTERFPWFVGLGLVLLLVEILLPRGRTRRSAK